jgi:O-antigen ligase
VPYAFFLLLNGILFIRPGELVDSLEPLRLYYVAILACMATSYQGMLSQMNSQSLCEHPMTLCVLGLLAAVVLSHLQFGSIFGARTSGSEFGKLVLYYLLLQHNVDGPDKFQRFLNYLVLFTLVAASLALLQYHEIVNIPALAAYAQREIDEETGEVTVFPRLCGSGIFNDPNDVCLMLMLVMMICIYRLMTPGAGPNRFVWLAPLAVFFLAFAGTKSRGGFIALMAAVNVLVVSRMGIKKAVPFWLVAAPVVLVLFGGRMTQIDTDDGTGQHRIRLWREALELVREYPLFGIGQGLLPDYLGLVAHNSYIHAYAELGLFGGTCFISLVYLAISQLWQLRRSETAIEDSELRRLRHYLLGIVCGFCAGILSLSRMYIVPTYLVFGLVAAYLNQVKVAPEEPSPLRQFNSSLFLRLVGISIAALVVLEIGSRLMVRWD